MNEKLLVKGIKNFVEYRKKKISELVDPSQEWNREPEEFPAKLCPLRSTITVDQDDKQPYDAYNRLVGKVTCSGKVLNSELLENGHAIILTQYCKKSEFAGDSWAKKFGC